jgi:hypothetical protein
VFLGGWRVSWNDGLVHLGVWLDWIVMLFLVDKQREVWDGCFV